MFTDKFNLIENQNNNYEEEKNKQYQNNYQDYKSRPVNEYREYNDNNYNRIRGNYQGYNRGFGGRGYSRGNGRGRGRFYHNDYNRYNSNRADHFYNQNSFFGNRQSNELNYNQNENYFKSNDMNYMNKQNNNINSNIPFYSNNYYNTNKESSQNHQFKKEDEKDEKTIYDIKPNINHLILDLSDSKFSNLLPNLISNKEKFSYLLEQYLKSQKIYKLTDNNQSLINKYITDLKKSSNNEYIYNTKRRDFFQITIFDIVNFLILKDNLLDADTEIDESFNEHLSIFKSNPKYINSQMIDIMSNYLNDEKRRKVKINNNLNYNYYPEICKLDKCNNRINCIYSHNQYEMDYHPIYYKTKRCSNDHHFSLKLRLISTSQVEEIENNDCEYVIEMNNIKNTLNSCPYYHSIDDFNNLYTNDYIDLVLSIKKHLSDYFLSSYNDEVYHFYELYIKTMTKYNTENFEYFNKKAIGKITKYLFKGFNLDTFKIFPCKDEDKCKWILDDNIKLCLFYHNNTSQKRRPLLLYQYDSSFCEDWKGVGGCIKDEFCEKCCMNRKYEYYYHFNNFRKIRNCELNKLKIKDVNCSLIQDKGLYSLYINNPCTSIFTCYAYHQSHLKKGDVILYSNLSSICVKCKEKIDVVDVNNDFSFDNSILDSHVLVCKGN